jgi:death on curing protein
LKKGDRHYVVTIDDVLEAHDRVIGQRGLAGVLNEDSIRSAIGRPYSGYYRTLNKKASVLLQSLAANHGFADGNKRTALLVVNLLIRNSGYDYVGLTERALNDELERLVIEAARGQLDLDAAFDWFKRHITRNIAGRTKRR